MIKKTISYVDLNGNERSDDFYFNLSKAELLEMELGEVGGLSEKLKQIVKETDAKKLVEAFKDIILKAYGVKSEDGRRFIKSDQLVLEFTQMEAYSTLFFELSTDAEKSAEFINGLIPAEMSKAVEAKAAPAPTGATVTVRQEDLILNRPPTRFYGETPFYSPGS